MKFPSIPGFEPTAFKKYFKNTGFLLAGKVGSLIIRMLVDFSVVNYLGKYQNGIINYASSFVFLFFAISGLGIDQFIVRELVKYPQKQNTIIGTSVLLRLFASLLIAPVIAIFYQIYPSVSTPATYVYILSTISFFQSFNVIDSYFQAQVKGKRIMQVNVIGNIISALLKLLFIALGLSLQWFVWALVFDAAIIALGYFVLYISEKGIQLKSSFDTSLAVELLKKSWPLMFSAVLVSIYMKIDQLMIGRILDESELGVYSTVVKLSEAWYFVPVAIVASLFPAIINAKQHSEERYLKRLQNLYDLMVVIGLSIAIIVTCFDDLIYQIIYKPEYAPGAPVLSVHIWAGIFSALGVASGQYLINEGFTKLALVRTTTGAIVNVGLNLILIPKMGIIGAALATLVAYFTATFFLIFVPDTRKQGVLMLKSLFLISLVQKIIKR